MFIDSSQALTRSLGSSWLTPRFLCAVLLAGTAGSDARRLVRLLRIDGRPRRVHQARGPVTLVQLEQRLEGLRLLDDRRPWVADGCQARRHGRDRQLVGVER